MRSKFMKRMMSVALGIGVIAVLTGCQLIPTKEDNGKEALQQAVTEEVVDSGESGTPDETGASAVKVEQDSSSESGVESAQPGTIESMNQFTAGTEGWTEDDWITWANDLFATACSLEFDYEAGGCITTDGSSTISVNGMDYYVATDYNSIEEATADYFSVFSKTGRENKFAEYMQEQDGRLYILPAARGSDIFYKESLVTSISNIGENTIEFTVENYYYEDLYDDPAEQENHITMTTDTFTVVFEDRVWKVLNLNLPY